MAKKKKSEQDKVYHNTLLLLKHYRDVVWSLTVAVEHVKHDFNSEFGRNIDDFLDTLCSAGTDLCGTDIEERAKSISRSSKMLKLVDNAVDTMRRKNKYGEIYYQVIYITTSYRRHTARMRRLSKRSVKAASRCAARP